MVFALFGTIGIIIGLFGLVEIVKQSNLLNINNNAVISSQEIEKTADKNQIRQILDLNMPIILDTSSNLYIFPISQKTLTRSINRNEIYTDFYEKIPNNAAMPQVSLSTKLWYGDYNNFVISENIGSNNHLVFNFRVSVNRLDYLNIPDQPLLLMSGSRKDSNKDKLFTTVDLQELFIYDVGSQKLSIVALDNATVMEYSYISNLDILVIKYGIDINKNGVFDYEREPTTLRKYSIKNTESILILDETILNKALDILNGKNQGKE